MKYIKKFATLSAFNSFVLDHTNTPNASLIEELTGSNRITYTPFIPAPVGHDYSLDYFTIEAIDDIDVFLDYKGVTDDHQPYPSYSIDNGSTWSTMDSAVSLSAGDKILFKHSEVICYGSNFTYQFYDGNGDVIQGRFNVEGNIMSLVYGDNFANQTSFPNSIDWQHAFNSIFYCQTNLISAENLILPVTTLTSGCYMSMFSGCTSLTTAPVLPATILVDDCYNYMFAWCSSLNYVKCLATDISAEYCIATWLDGVNSTGTFIKNPNMTSWPIGDNGIPSGWTVQDA